MGFRYVFQSYLTGIEINYSSIAFLNLISFQSYLTGIEISRWLAVAHLEVCSNRTLLELK